MQALQQLQFLPNQIHTRSHCQYEARARMVILSPCYDFAEDSWGWNVDGSLAWDLSRIADDRLDDGAAFEPDPRSSRGSSCLSIDARLMEDFEVGTHLDSSIANSSNSGDADSLPGLKIGDKIFLF